MNSHLYYLLMSNVLTQYQPIRSLPLSTEPSRFSSSTQRWWGVLGISSIVGGLIFMGW